MLPLDLTYIKRLGSVLLQKRPVSHVCTLQSLALIAKTLKLGTFLARVLSVSSLLNTITQLHSRDVLIDILSNARGYIVTREPPASPLQSLELTLLSYLPQL